MSTGFLGCAGISVYDIIPFCSCTDATEWEKLDKGYVTMGKASTGTVIETRRG